MALLLRHAASKSITCPTLLFSLGSLDDSLVLGDILVLGAHALEDCGSLCGELAPHADSLAVLVEQEGERHAGEGQEGRDGAGPVDAEVLVHVRREERECSAKEGTQNRVCGQDRGSEDDVWKRVR